MVGHGVAPPPRRRCDTGPSGSVAPGAGTTFGSAGDGTSTPAPTVTCSSPRAGHMEWSAERAGDQRSDRRRGIGNAPGV